jgi:hypothetical protein
MLIKTQTKNQLDEEQKKNERESDRENRNKNDNKWKTGFENPFPRLCNAKKECGIPGY